MALNFDVRNVHNYAEVTTHPADDTKWHPVTECLVFATISIGIDKITEQNYREFFQRMVVMDYALGSKPLYVDGEPTAIALEDVRMHIGLSTNASTLTKATFRKKLYEWMENRVWSSPGARDGVTSTHQRIQEAITAAQQEGNNA